MAKYKQSIETTDYIDTLWMWISLLDVEVWKEKTTLYKQVLQSINKERIS